MKKIFTLLITLAFVMPVAAQNLYMVMSDGTENVIPVASLKKITFEKTEVTATLLNGTTSAADMKDITRAYFATESGIEDADADRKGLVTYVTNDEIAVNCEAGEKIEIYNISGMHVLSVTQSSDGGTVSIAALPKGIYLLRVNRQTAKIIKR